MPDACGAGGSQTAAQSPTGSPPAWTADVQLSDRAARYLIESQFPELAPVRLEPLGEGWDNRAYLVNGQLVFRFPRRRVAADLLAAEARVLRVVAPQLPVQVPSPEYDGAPDGDYPYPFSGYPLIRGITACRYTWNNGARTRLAVRLAGFLAALHTIPIDSAMLTRAPHDDICRSDTSRRAPNLRERLLALPQGIPGIDVPRLLDAVERGAAAQPYAGPPCWVHGDFYACHLLIDAVGSLVGVIDWGDVHVGDPALDLSIAYSFLPPEARGTFCRAYGAANSSTRDRARFRAVHYGVMLREYGRQVGDEAIAAAGEYALASSAA